MQKLDTLVSQLETWEARQAKTSSRLKECDEKINQIKSDIAAQKNKNIIKVLETYSFSFNPDDIKTAYDWEELLTGQLEKFKEQRRINNEQESDE